MKKTVIITGAGRGIGLSLADIFAHNEWNVLANCRKFPLEGNAQVNNKIRYKDVELYPADVTRREQVDCMVDFCVARFGAVDLLINNAGVSQSKLFIDISEEDWNTIFDTNLKAIFHCTQSVLRYMLPKKSGQIINIASIWGLVGASCEVHYSAAKAGVIGLTKSLAKELGPSNIRVNCIAPGIIQTDMLNGYNTEDIIEMQKNTPLQRLGNPDEIAACALFLSSEEASFFTGQIFSPNGGLVI